MEYIYKHTQQQRYTSLLLLLGCRFRAIVLARILLAAYCRLLVAAVVIITVIKVVIVAITVIDILVVIVVLLLLLQLLLLIHSTAYAVFKTAREIS